MPAEHIETHTGRREDAAPRTRTAWDWDAVGDEERREVERLRKQIASLEREVAFALGRENATGAALKRLADGGPVRRRRVLAELREDGLL